MTKEGMFRPQAVEHHRSGEVSGGLLEVTPPWLVGLFGTLLAIMLLALAVVFLVDVRIYSEGRGIVRPRERVLVVRAPIGGVVAQVQAEEGGWVEQGDLILRFDDVTLRSDPEYVEAPEAVRQVQRERLEVRAATTGVLDRLDVRAGDVVDGGAVLARIVPSTDRNQLIGRLWLPERDWPYLRVGEPVQLRFDGYPWEEMGVGRGRITRVAEDLAPAGADDGGQEAAPVFDQRRVMVEVEIDSLPPRAESARLRNGMLFTGEVVLREQRIAVLLLRPLARLFGE